MGGPLVEPGRWAEVAELVKPRDFYRPDHALIFVAIATLAEAGKPADIVLVVEQLRRTEELESAGGFAYIGSLARQTTTAAHIVHYANIIAKRARLRRLPDLGVTIENAIADNFDSVQIINSLQLTLDQLPRGEAYPAAKAMALEPVSTWADRPNPAPRRPFMGRVLA